MNYYILGFKKYAQFTGRATKAEFWYFTLFNYSIFFALEFISYIIGDDEDVLGYLFFLATITPWLAVLVRRLHDIGKSGWWILTGLFLIWLIVLLSLDSEPGENKYGSNPNPNHVPISEAKKQEIYEKSKKHWRKISMVLGILIFLWLLGQMITLVYINR